MLHIAILVVALFIIVGYKFKVLSTCATNNTLYQGRLYLRSCPKIIVDIFLLQKYVCLELYTP